MLTETATVIATATDGVWVEALDQHQCQRCAANKGCGHSLLNAAHARRSNRIKAFSTNRLLLQSIHCGDSVAIGIQEHLVLKASLLLYLLPVATMLLATLAAGMVAENEALSIVSALLGLGAGFYLLRRPLMLGLLPGQMQAILLGMADAPDLNKRVNEISTLKITNT